MKIMDYYIYKDYISSILENRKINNCTMDSYITIINPQEDTTYFDTTFLPWYKKNESYYSEHELKSKLEYLWVVKRWLFAVEVTQNHVGLIHVDLDNHIISIYDCRYKELDYLEWLELVQNLVYLFIIDTDFWPFDTVVEKVITPSDDNCGIYTMLNAKRILYKEDIVASFDNNEKLREKIALDILTPFLTAFEDDSTVIDCPCGYSCKSFVSYISNI